MVQHWYSDTERRVGLVPLDGSVRITVTGTMEAVDRALTELFRLWVLRPCSSIGWDSLGRPEEGDGTSATFLATIRDVKAELMQQTLGRDADPTGGQAVSAGSGHLVS